MSLRVKAHALVRVRFVFHGGAVLEVEDLADLIANDRLEASIASPDGQGISLRAGAHDDSNNLGLLPELSNAGEHELLPESRQVGAVTLEADGPAASVAEALPRRSDLITEQMIVAIVVQLGGTLQVGIVTRIEKAAGMLARCFVGRGRGREAMKAARTYSTKPSSVLKVPRCLRLLVNPSAEALDPEVFLEYQKDQGV